MDKLINEDVRTLADMLAKKSIRNNFIDQLQDLQGNINGVAQAELAINQLAGAAIDMGDLSSGRVLALSAGVEPTDATATGSFVSADGETFASDTYNIGGISNGELQFGLSSTTGAAFAGGGAVVLDSAGITLDATNNQSIIRMTNANMAQTGGNDLMLTQTETIPDTGETRVFNIGMSSNGTNPEGVISYYEPSSDVTVPNGNFATNDITDWSQVVKGLEAAVYATKTWTGSVISLNRTVWNGTDLYASVRGKGIWKYSSSTWSQVGTLNKSINDLLWVGATLYACGIDLSTGKALLAKWDGATWTSYSVAGTSSVFYCMVADSSGNVYLGGEALPTNQVWKFTTASSTLAAHGTGLVNAQAIYGLKIINTGGTDYLYCAGSWLQSSYSYAVKRCNLTGTITFTNYGSLTGSGGYYSFSLFSSGTVLYLYGETGIWKNDTAVNTTFIQYHSTRTFLIYASNMAMGAGNNVYLYDYPTKNIYIFDRSTNGLVQYGATYTGEYPHMSFSTYLYIGQESYAGGGAISPGNDTITIYKYDNTANWTAASGYGTISSIEPGTTVELKTAVTSTTPERIAVTSGNSYTFSADTFGSTTAGTITLNVQAQFYAAATGGSATSTVTFITRSGASLPWLTNSATISAGNSYVEFHVLGTSTEGVVTISCDNFSLNAANSTALTFKDDGLYYTPLAGTASKLGGGGSVLLTNNSGGTVTVGAVVIIDTSTASAFKTTTVESDRRVFGVVKDASVAAGAAGNIAIGGSIETVQVTGNVDLGNALVSSTTAGMAKASGGARQNGIIGFAVTAYAGGSTGTVQAIISPEFGLASATVVVEGVTATTGTAQSGTLVCGTNSDRLVVAVSFAVHAGGAPVISGATVAGSAMTQTGADFTTVFSTGTYTSSLVRLYYYKNPPTGTVSIGETCTANGSIYSTIWIALSGVKSSSYFGTLRYNLQTTTAQSVQATDAVAGDLMIGAVIASKDAGWTTALVSSSGSGQTSKYLGVPDGKSVIALDIKTATSATETMGWTLATSQKAIALSIPIKPA